MTSRDAVDDMELREQVIATACCLHKDGLTVANSGNVSVRSARGLLITPSGVAYESLQLEDVVELTLNGQQLSGRFSPSSEWHFHCGIYQSKPEVNGIVHAHSPAATALSCLNKPLPAFHYMVALAGGIEIPCSEYATFGTEALSLAVLEALQHHKACLMANHGQTATGKSLASAYNLALEVESLCDIYMRASAITEPVLLSKVQMQEAANAFNGYGQKLPK